MIIECLKEKLSKALMKAERVSGKNVTLPILSCILLEAKDSNLIIKSTNLDLGLEIKLPVKVVNEGSVAVSASILNNFISNIQNEKNITLEFLDGNLKVLTKQSQAIIKTFPTDDFPSIPKIDSGSSFTFSNTDLLKGLKSVYYSASVSTIRPVLSSVMVYSEEDSVVFVATDSFRLSEKKIKTKKHKDFNQIIIPLKNVLEIIKVLDDVKDDINISINQNQISFMYEGFYLTSRVVDGDFPDYKQIIPKGVKTEVVVLKQDLVSALKISNIFSDKFSKVTFNIEPRNKKLIITTKNNDIGENENSIEAVVKGEELSINFNYKYITDCFQSVDNDSISLEFFDANKPMVVSGVGDKSFLYLVMPMNK